MDLGSDILSKTAIQGGFFKIDKHSRTSSFCDFLGSRKIASYATPGEHAGFLMLFKVAGLQFFSVTRVLAK